VIEVAENGLYAKVHAAHIGVGKVVLKTLAT